MAKSVKIDTVALGNRMEELGLSRKDLADRSGVTYATISRALREGSTSYETAMELSEHLGVSLCVSDEVDHVTQRLQEAEASGNKYRLVPQRYVFQVGIDHPDGKFLVRHSSSLKKEAESALKRFNSTSL